MTDDIQRFRGDAPELADAEFPPCPMACASENAVLAILRKTLVCDDATFNRIVSGGKEMRRQRQYEWDTLPREHFIERWTPRDESNI